MGSERALPRVAEEPLRNRRFEVGAKPWRRLRAETTSGWLLGRVVRAKDDGHLPEVDLGPVVERHLSHDLSAIDRGHPAP